MTITKTKMLARAGSIDAARNVWRVMKMTRCLYADMRYALCGIRNRFNWHSKSSAHRVQSINQLFHFFIMPAIMVGNNWNRLLIAVPFRLDKEEKSNEWGQVHVLRYVLHVSVALATFQLPDATCRTHCSSTAKEWDARNNKAHTRPVITMLHWPDHLLVGCSMPIFIWVSNWKIVTYGML